MDETFRIAGKGSLLFIAIVVFAILLLILIPFILLGLAGTAFSRLGFSWIAAIAIIILMLIGYFVNIPVISLKTAGNGAHDGRNDVFDAFSGEPVGNGSSSTTITLNLGGFFIPVGVLAYLLYETGHIMSARIFFSIAVCILVVSLIMAALTRIDPILGIRTPQVIPALSAIACGVLLSGGIGLESALIAFAGGIVGILLGASAVSLVRVRRAGLHRINIGGAGMFGPIFICALLSALIA